MRGRPVTTWQDHRSASAAAPLPMCFPVGGCWEAKVQEMPDFIGERGGTRTLDPMIKSHSTRVGNVCSDLQRTPRTYIEGNGTRHQVSRQLAQRKHHRGPDLKMLGIA